MNSKPALSSRSPVITAVVSLLIFLALVLIGLNAVGSDPLEQPPRLRAVFVGDWRIGDGEWQPIVEGQHIPATHGDVTLRGNFYMLAPDGTPAEKVGLFTSLAFHLNHINIEIHEGSAEPFVSSHEAPGRDASGCGHAWVRYFLSDEALEPIEIIIRNPHVFGNGAAVDELLRNFYIWTAPDFEREVIASSTLSQSMSVLFFVTAVVMMGVAIFAATIHVRRSNSIMFTGLTVLCASGFFYFNTDAAFFQSNNVALNTTVREICMMFYMLFVSGLITFSLHRMRRAALLVLAAMAAACGVLLIFSIVTSVMFYDLIIWWVLAQSLCCLALTGIMITEYIRSVDPKRWSNLLLSIPFLGFVVDMYAAVHSLWETGRMSQLAFAVLFVIAVLMVWRSIPRRINAILASKETEAQNAILKAEKAVIEAELKESRVSIMFSQIRPHFIYNTLGTIERMCLKDPQKAFELVRNFSLYLRANFGELGSVTPIRFMEEISHVEHYGYIEKTRFPDMEIRYELEATDFVLPALTVQPLVENAIKHGLMRLESGGTVTIRSYETDTHYCVEVSDNGVGFDPDAPIDEKKHVGLRNIQGRLSTMVNGTLTIDSAPDRGTKATISIPKEENA